MATCCCTRHRPINNGALQVDAPLLYFSILLRRALVNILSNEERKAVCPWQPAAHRLKLLLYIITTTAGGRMSDSRFSIPRIVMFFQLVLKSEFGKQPTQPAD